MTFTEFYLAALGILAAILTSLPFFAVAYILWLVLNGMLAPKEPDKK